MIFGIFQGIGVMSFVYLVWRRLREDYKEDRLISYTWLSLLTVLVVGRIGFGIINWGVWSESWSYWLMLWQKPGFSYLSGLIGLMCVTAWYCKKEEWKIWSFMESLTSMLYLSMVFFMLADKQWIYVGVAIIGLVISWWISGKYRSFVWYRSGKKGFVFFFTNIIVGILLALVSWWLKDGPIMPFVYLGWSLISTVGLVILGNE